MSPCAMQRDVLRAMARHHGKAEPLEQRAQQFRIRRRVFDELEPVGAHRIVMGFAHNLGSAARSVSVTAGRIIRPAGGGASRRGVYNPRRARGPQA